jgi:hypothetical protein
MHAKGRLAISILAIAAFGGLCLLGALLAFTPGGGGSTQVAPDAIKVETPATIQLELSVWGKGGPIKGRYTEISLHYRLVGENTYTTVKPKLVFQGREREIYEFTIPPYPRGASGEIEYYFDLKLDGHYSRVVGMKRIPLIE